MASKRSQHWPFKEASVTLSYEGCYDVHQACMMTLFGRIAYKVIELINLINLINLSSLVISLLVKAE